MHKIATGHDKNFNVLYAAATLSSKIKGEKERGMERGEKGLSQLKLSRLLVTHDRGKLSWISELSLAECSQGRYGYPSARVTLAAL